MLIEEISDLARTYEETILSNKLTKAEAVMLLALIDARVKSKLFTTTPTVAPVAASTVKFPDDAVKPILPDVVPEKKKGISYDPLYDPAPPFDVEPLPPQTTTGGIIAQKGHACVCNSCTRVVYMVNKDIPDNCKIPDFIASFTPIDESFPVITKKVEIMNVDGQISMDCPLCRGSKTLYLTGKK